ncbi:MAG TPA: class I SAM-dependent methyltransferase [Actinomycetota bacterium]|nr:class I SAM-dependent methyltransferase [Actinomycetota bacterium]
MHQSEHEAIRWQTGVWDTISDIYERQIDRRFAPVVEHTLTRAGLASGHSVLDLGTGTGSAALKAAQLVAPGGSVLGVDLSAEMLEIAHGRAERAGLRNVSFREGRAEELPAEDDTFDAIVSSLCFMYVIDRAAGAAESARVLKPSGRFVAAVWGGPDECDIVLFQSTAGSFAPPPPVTGVGPGALADPSSLVAHLRDAGIEARVESETLSFEFPDFETAWDVLAGVTTAKLTDERRDEAKAAVRDVMWPDPNEPRVFVNTTQFVVGTRIESAARSRSRA